MTQSPDQPLEYVFTKRHFTGTHANVLAQFDGLIVRLLGARMISLQDTPSDASPTERPARFHLVPSLFGLFLLVGAPIAVAGQQPDSAMIKSATSGQKPADTTSQSATSPFEHVRFGVTLEGYYQFNGNRPHDRVNLLRAYDTRANVFSIQQAAIVIESAPVVDEGRRFGARLDLQFGQATETVQGNPANEPRPEAYRHVWQAYGTYVFPIGRGLQTDFGKFASNLGYETNYAKDNSHFSRAYLFNFLPFYHSGLRLTLPVRDDVTVMYVLTNGIQQTEDFNNFKSHHVTGIVMLPANIVWTLNYFLGQEQPDGGAPDGPDGFFRVFDTYLTYAPTAALRVGLDANYVSNEVHRADAALALQGAAVYARYQVSAPTAVAVRYERLDDEGLFGGVDQVLHEVTATAEYAFADGFLTRAEFRRDWSNRAFFTTDRPGLLRTAQNTVTLGLVWWFGNKRGTW